MEKKKLVLQYSKDCVYVSVGVGVCVERGYNSFSRKNYICLNKLLDYFTSGASRLGLAN